MNKQIKVDVLIRFVWKHFARVQHTLLVTVLTLSLALSGGGIYLFVSSKAQAATPVEDAEELDRLYSADLESSQDFNAQWGQLDQIPAGQPKSSIAADRFLLMEQSVQPKEIPVVSQFPGQILRLQKLATLLGRVQGYIKAIDQGNTPAKTFVDLDVIPELKEKEIVELTTKYIAEERKSDTPEFVWLRRRDRAQLEILRVNIEKMFASWQQNRSLKVANYTGAALVRRARAVNWWDTNITINEHKAISKILPMADTARLRSLSGRDPYFCSSEACQFDISYKGETLHRFGITSRVVGTYGQFLIFTHQDSFDEKTGVQYISFIDLEAYSTSIGNEDLPIFRMPIKTDRPLESLKIANGKLILNGDHWLDAEILQDASDLQQMAFNLTSNLVNPSEWAATLPMIDAFREQVRKIMMNSVADSVSEYQGLKKTQVLFSQLGQELQTQLDKTAEVKPTVPKLTDAQLEQAKKDTRFETTARGVELYHKRVKDSGIVASRMDALTKRNSDSRKLKGRVDLLMSQLLSPKPWASQRIKEAVAMHLVRRGDLFSSQRGIWSNFMDRPFLNSGVVVAGLMATFMPESFHHLVVSGLGVGSSVLDYTMFTLRGIGEAFSTGTSRTFAALYEPVSAIGDQYINNGNWYRTLIGLGVFVPTILSLYYIPHFLFNYNKYLKDIKSGKVTNLVEQQTLMRKAYFKRLADEEGTKHTGSAVVLSEDDKKGVSQWLEDRKSGKHKSVGWFSRVFLGKNAANGEEENAEKKAFAETVIEQNIETQTVAIAAGEKSQAIAEVSSIDKKELKGFWSAAIHFAFAMPSYETTLHRWASFWNWYAGWRFCSIGFKGVRVCKTNVPLFISPKPVMFSARVIYPDLFSTVVAKRDKKLVLPTQLNGGLRTRGVSDFVGIFSNLAAEKVRARISGSSIEQLHALEKFEDQIIDVESEVIKVAFEKSLADLAKFVTNKKDLEIIFGSSPIDSITNSQIRDLSTGAQNFLRAHFESIYEQSMKQYMTELVEAEAVAAPLTPQDIDQVDAKESAEQLAIAKSGTSLAGEIGDMDLVELKNTYISKTNGKQTSFDFARAKTIANDVARNPSHRLAALEAVRVGRLSIKNTLRNAKFNSVANLDPVQNPSMARWNVVHKRLQSPGALGRAVRSEVSKLLVTFPLDLFMKMFLAAGIMEGAFKPIQEAFLGPNSIAHFSLTSFYMVTAASFVMGMMADAWVKVQMDQRQDDMGEFGHVPKGEDAVRGLTRWYTKNFFAPANSLWQNYLFDNKVIFWNLPAALFNISLFYFAFSGRIDISLILAGYVVAFGTPLMAIHSKLDQAFERSVHYAARGLKKELWLADPRVQEQLMKEQQRMRNRFTFWHDFFTGVEGNWTTNVETVPTSLGPRGFARAIFGGKLLEEYIIEKILDPARSAATGVPFLGPMVDSFTNTCQLLLTRGNPDIRLPGK